MKLRNYTPPHLVKHPCRRCGEPTKALKNGQIIRNPMCGGCTVEEEKEFKLARLAADRQFRNRMRIKNKR